MNRARELRSRMKDSDYHDGASSVTSMASKSEIARQRRSRQLEATQRLLDGQGGGFNLTEPSSSGRSVSSKPVGDDRSRQAPSESRPHRAPTSSKALDRDGQLLGSESSHSIISQKHLGQIHRRYEKPADTESPRRLDAETLETRLLENRYTPQPSSAMLDDTPHSTLRDRPVVEGRGRGRGRGRARPSGSGGTSSLGEHSRSSKSHSHSSSTRKEDVMEESRLASSPPRQPSAAARQQQKTDESEKRALQAYLKCAPGCLLLTAPSSCL